MAGRDLSRLMAPKSVAVLGGIWADTVAEQCAALGFAGPIYRVHPGRAANGDSRFWRDLSSLPEVPDAVFVGVNREATVEVMREASGLGVGGAVCFASGFGESQGQEGRARAERLLDAAGTMPFLGPNCYGAANFFDRVSLFPDQLPKESPGRGVCIASQSGTVACNVLYAKRTLPIGHLLTIGNQSSVSITDVIDAALTDGRVTAIGAYLEDIPDIRAFARAAERAMKGRVPIVVFKAGRSAVARKTTASHTGALGGQERHLDALFSRLGIARCDTLAEFVETLKILHVHGPLPEATVAVAGASGGDMAMAADVAGDAGVGFPELPQPVAGQLQRLLGPDVAVANPLDFHTGIWHDRNRMEEVFATFQQGPAAITVLQVDHPDPDLYDASSFDLPVRAFLDAAEKTGCRAVTLSSMPESQPEPLRRAALAAGVAPMQGMQEAFRAVANAARIGRAWDTYSRPELAPPPHTGPAAPLSEIESKRLLQKAQIAVPRGREARIDQATDAAERLGYPVVLKASSPSLLHKSDRGGVVLNLNSTAEVAAAADHLAGLSDRVLVEKMADGGVAEMIVAVQVDPRFGPVILMGAGGLLAELIEDTVFLLPPVSRVEIAEALDSLRCARLLDGYRGGPVADRQALIDTVAALAAFVAANCDRLVELEINPLLVRAEGQGVLALDAVAWLREERNR